MACIGEYKAERDAERLQKETEFSMTHTLQNNKERLTGAAKAFTK
jgi:hypothetical protein